MKSVLLGLFVALEVLTFAQRTYHFSYDKANDTWSYFHVKMVGGKSEKIPLKKRLPKLKETDIVQVEVVNYNPFLYYVEILQEDNIVTTGNTSGVTGIVNLLSGGLNMFNGIGTGIGLLGGASRGESEVVDVSNQKEWELFSKDAQVVTAQISSFKKRYSNFLLAIEHLEAEHLALMKAEVLLELEQCLKEYYDPRQLLTEYVPSMKLHYLKAGVSEERYKLQMTELEESIKQFKEELTSVEGSYSKEAIQQLIAQLKVAKFSQQVKFQMGKTEQFTLNTEDTELAKNEVLFGKRFVLNFYNRHDLNSSGQEGNNSNNGYGSSAPVFVRYYWQNRYWTPKGELVNENCNGCQPLVRAEGLYEGPPPRNLFTLWDNVDGDFDSDWPEKYPLRDEAIEDWVFYDTNGVVDFVSIAPRFDGALETAWEKEFAKTYDSEELENKPHQRRMVELPVSGGFNVSWSSGIYAVGAFGPRYSYSLFSNATMDSVIVKGTTTSNLRTCIGSQMDFQFFGTKAITPTINLGAAMDVWNDREINFVLGGGLRFKAFPYLGLSGGLSFTRMQFLNEQVRIGDLLEGSYSDYLDSSSFSYKTINGAPLIEKKYRPGYYFGINIAF